MKALSKFSPLLMLLFLSLLSLTTFAQSNVVVVPLLGDSTELKPIKFSDLIDERRAFTLSTNQLTVGTVTNERKFVITSITVAPESYPSTLSPIRLRFCYDGAVLRCTHGISAPNNTTTKIDFGFGQTFTANGRHYIDLTSRGGLPQNTSNQIQVFVSGYFYNI